MSGPNIWNCFFFFFFDKTSTFALCLSRIYLRVGQVRRLIMNYVSSMPLNSFWLRFIGSILNFDPPNLTYRINFIIIKRTITCTGLIIQLGFIDRGIWGNGRMWEGRERRRNPVDKTIIRREIKCQIDNIILFRFW